MCTHNNTTHTCTIYVHDTCIHITLRNLLLQKLKSVYAKSKIYLPLNCTLIKQFKLVHITTLHRMHAHTDTHCNQSMLHCHDEYPDTTCSDTRKYNTYPLHTEHLLKMLTFDDHTCHGLAKLYTLVGLSQHVGSRSSEDHELLHSP